MSKIDRNVIEQIKERIDIVQYIGIFVRLKRAGKDYKGLCPFHTEKTPSFTVAPDKGFYHCFGCNRNGDIIDFVQRYDAVNFYEAVEILADYSSIDITKEEEEAEEYIALKLNREAMKLYLNDGRQTVKTFFDKRRLSLDLIDIFNVGYTDSNLVSQKLKENRDILEKIGLLFKKDSGQYVDRFNQRIVFPIIHNRYPIGFGGRKTLEWQESKYINSKSSMIYDKSRALFGLSQSRKVMRDTGFTYLVEGYTDVLSLWTMGIKNAIAGCGTALTHKQANILSGTCHSVRVMYDGDVPGNKAAYKAVVALLKSGIIPYVTELPKGLDPNSLLVERGAEKAKEFIDSHSKIFYKHYGEMVSGHPAHKRIILIKELQSAVEAIIDNITRYVLQQDISNYFNITYNGINRKGKRARAMSIDQQMMACLLNEQIGDGVFSMVKAEDFLEEADIFEYILGGYKRNKPRDIKGLLSKYKDRSSYITRAIAPPFQVTKNRANILARKLRLRTISSLITKVTNQIEKKVNEEKDFSDLQNKWDELRAEQLTLGNITDLPQW